MEIINVVQKTDEWLAVRAQYDTASEASMMKGEHKSVTRSRLIELKATGAEEEYSSWVKDVLFPRGEDVEANSIGIAENIVGDGLFSITGVKGSLLASFDGLTMSGLVCWECKQWNSDKVADVTNGVIPACDEWQVKQQLVVSGAEKCLYMVTDGTEENCVWMWVMADPSYERDLLDGWGQFHKDVADYVPAAVVIEPVAAPVAALPAISYQLNGMAIQSNLDAYRDAAERMVEDSKLPIATDPEFAAAEVRNKALRVAVKNLDGLLDRVINDFDGFAKFRAAVLEIRENIRLSALAGEKQVKSRKQTMRFEIISAANLALADHCSALDSELVGAPYIDGFATDFAGAAKGKSLLASVQSAVNDELARAKIEVDGIARRIRANLKTLSEDAAEYKFLFADFKQLVHKDPDDLGALVRDRIATHKAEEGLKAEKKRAAEHIAAAERKAAEERKADQERKAEDATRQAPIEQPPMATTIGSKAPPAAQNTTASIDAGENHQATREVPATETPSNIGTEIVDSLVAQGIPPGPAARVAKLIVNGSVARVAVV